MFGITSVKNFYSFHLMGIIMSVAVAISGLLVLFFGDFRQMKLKFIAVSFTTIAAIWFIVYYYIFYDIAACRATQDMCTITDMYFGMRNLAFLLFNVAVGRDAIAYYKKDRRKGVDV